MLLRSGNAATKSGFFKEKPLFHLKKCLTSFLIKSRSALRPGYAPMAHNSTPALRKVFSRVHAAGKRLNDISRLPAQNSCGDFFVRPERLPLGETAPACRSAYVCLSRHRFRKTRQPLARAHSSFSILGSCSSMVSVLNWHVPTFL